MTYLAGPNKCDREKRRGQLSGVLFVLWLLAIAVVWTLFAIAPVGALATANAGRLVAIRGTTVTTTNGYFQVSTAPSAQRGTALRVIRTNSLWSDTGLQLCASRNAGNDYWCSDISDGYAGDLSETSLGRRAWSHGMRAILLLAAIFLTMFGWFPAVAVACSGGTRVEDELTPTSEG